MDTVDLLITARWILPIAPDHSVLENYAVLLRGDRIVDLLPREHAMQRYSAKHTLELKDHVLMPGMVNAHTHTPMNLFRGLADDLPLMSWLNNHIWPAEGELINAESVTTGTRLAIAEMIRGGTTCFNDNYFFHDVIAQTAIEAGMRACVGFVIMSVPTKWAQEETGYFNKMMSTLDQLKKHPLITWSIAPHAPYTVSDNSLRRVKELSDQWQLPIHMHMHEAAPEIASSIKEFGMRPLARINKLGLLSPRFINVHMTQLTEDEIKLVKETGAHVVHCPESNLKLASGYSPVVSLMNEGINVALGTDGAASNNDLDMWGELRTASLLAKDKTQDPTSLPAKQALAMATIHGAKALGLEKEIGSIEPGKAADLIAINLASYLTQPIYSPISHLAYAVNRLQVSDVWIAGKRVLKNGEFTQLKIDSIVEEAKQWAEKASPFKADISTTHKEEVS